MEEELKYRTIGKSHIQYVSQKHSRATLHAEGTHSIHAHFTHVHALVGDLDHAALEVLLIKHIHLNGNKEKRQLGHFWLLCKERFNLS